MPLMLETLSIVKEPAELTTAIPSTIQSLRRILALSGAQDINPRGWKPVIG